MKSLKALDKQFLRRNYWRLAVFAIALVIMAINTIRLYHLGPFTSDGVYTQNFLSVLQNHAHQQAIFNEDSYLLKIPFYWLVMHIGLSPLHSLWVTYISFIVFAYYGFYLGVAWLNRIFKWFNEKYFAVAFIYLVSLSRPYEYMMIANTRNMEIGLSFLLLIPLAVAFTKGSLSRWYKVAVVLVLSLLLFEDPYFLFAFFLPLLGLIISGLLIKKKSGHWLAGGMIVVSAALAKVWAIVSRHLGIFLNNVPLQFVGWGSLVINLKATIVALLLLAGGVYYNGNFHLKSASFYANSLIIAVLMIYSFGLIAFNLKRIKTEPWKIFIISIPWVISILFFLQPNPITINYRYMLMAAFGFPIILAFLMQNLKKRSYLVVSFAVVVLAILLNLHHTPETVTLRGGSNVINAQIAKEVKSLGLTKGYADYWDGNINTYFAGGKIYFLPVTCMQGRLQPMYWLVDSGEFTKVKSQKTFYLFDTQGFYINGCTPESLSAAYGPPAMIKAIDSQYEIVVYNYDLNTKMQYNFPRK